MLHSQVGNSIEFNYEMTLQPLHHREEEGEAVIDRFNMQYSRRPSTAVDDKPCIIKGLAKTSTRDPAGDIAPIYFGALEGFSEPVLSSPDLPRHRCEWLPYSHGLAKAR